MTSVHVSRADAFACVQWTLGQVVCRCVCVCVCVCVSEFVRVYREREREKERERMYVTAYSVVCCCSTLQVACQGGREVLDAFLASLGNKLYTTDASDE